MSATTQNRIIKQSQTKPKAGEPVKPPRSLQPTTEQLRMADLLQKSGASASEAEIAAKVAELCDAAQCSEVDALLALQDADNDPNRALNMLLERGEVDEWQQATAKKNKKTAQSNGEREVNEPPRATESKRGRGRPRTHANGEENGRAPRTRRAAPAETHEEPQNRVNGHDASEAQTDEHAWQPSRSRGDRPRKTQDAPEGERGAPARRGEARSVNRLMGRGHAAQRGRSAGPQGSRTYVRGQNENGDGDDANPQLTDDSKLPVSDKKHQQTSQKARGAAADEWTNDEWQGGAGSWQNTDSSRSRDSAPAAHKDTTETVVSFASIVAQRGNQNANRSTGATSNTQANANAKSDQHSQNHSHNAAREQQTPTVAAATATTNAAPPSQPQQPAHPHPQPQAQTQPQPQTQTQQQQLHAATTAEPQQVQQQQREDASALAQRSVASAAPQNTQKIELSDLLSKPTPQTQPASQPAALSVTARQPNAPFGTLSQQTAPLAGLSQPGAFTQASLPAASLAVGSQTQPSANRAIASATQPSRLLQDEAVVMPFKVSESLSSAFQFGFNADYVNPSPALEPARSQQNAPFSQTAANTAHAAPFADSLAKNATQSAPGRSFGPQAAFASVAPQNAPQPSAQANSASVTAGMGRIALDNDASASSAIKATANAFVPAHLGNSQQSESAQPTQQTQQTQRSEPSQFGSSQQYFAYAVSQSAPFAPQHSSANSQQTASSASQSQNQINNAENNTSNSQANIAVSQQSVVSSASTTAGHLQAKSLHVENSRHLANAALSSQEDNSNYPLARQNNATSAPNVSQNANSQAALQHMFNQLAANLFQNVPPTQGAQNAPPSVSGPLSSAAPGGFNAPGAPSQAQQYNVSPYVFPTYHNAATFAQAQQLISLLQHGQSAPQPFAAVSQSQSAAASGTQTQSNAAPPFNAATQFGINLHPTMVGGANASQSAPGAAQSSAQQNTAKLLAAAASSGSFASQSYATTGDDSATAFGSPSMFLGNDYQRQPGVMPQYQPQKGGATDYSTFKPQAHVGVVGTPMIEKAGGAYYNAGGANQVQASGNPPPGLGSVAGGQSAVSALSAASFGMYAAPNAAAHHQYMMTATTHPGMFMPGGMVSAAGAIGAQKAATPTKPPGFQNTGNWQQPY